MDYTQIIIIIVLLYLLYKVEFSKNNIENMENVDIETIRNEINKQYNMDIEAIRNLGTISKSLLTGKNYHNTETSKPGTLTIPADVIIEGNISVKGNGDVNGNLVLGDTLSWDKETDNGREQTGATIKARENGMIDFNKDSKQVIHPWGDISIGGDIRVDGNINSSGNVTASGTGQFGVAKVGTSGDNYAIMSHKDYFDYRSAGLTQKPSGHSYLGCKAGTYATVENGWKTIIEFNKDNIKLGKPIADIAIHTNNSQADNDYNSKLYLTDRYSTYHTNGGPKPGNLFTSEIGNWKTYRSDKWSIEPL